MKGMVQLQISKTRLLGCIYLCVCVRVCVYVCAYLHTYTLLHCMYHNEEREAKNDNAAGV